MDRYKSKIFLNSMIQESNIFVFTWQWGLSSVSATHLKGQNYERGVEIEGETKRHSCKNVGELKSPQPQWLDLVPH